VVIFGGDGTVNGLLPLLCARALPLAVFPAGTVNDLAR
jgi:diacylglycerol kinase (ATP)